MRESCAHLWKTGRVWMCKWLNERWDGWLGLNRGAKYMFVCFLERDRQKEPEEMFFLCHWVSLIAIRVTWKGRKTKGGSTKFNYEDQWTHGWNIFLPLMNMFLWLRVHFKHQNAMTDNYETTDQCLFYEFLKNRDVASKKKQSKVGCFLFANIQIKYFDSSLEWLRGGWSLSALIWAKVFAHGQVVSLSQCQLKEGKSNYTHSHPHLQANRSHQLTKISWEEARVPVENPRRHRRSMEAAHGKPPPPT